MWKGGGGFAKFCNRTGENFGKRSSGCSFDLLGPFRPSSLHCYSRLQAEFSVMQSDSVIIFPISVTPSSSVLRLSSPCASLPYESSAIHILLHLPIINHPTNIRIRTHNVHRPIDIALNLPHSTEKYSCLCGYLCTTVCRCMREWIHCSYTHL